MSDEDHDFTQQGGGDNASKTYPMAAGALKKGGYICINSRPCKVIDLSVSKTGKHGHAKVSIVATDIFTGNRLEDQAPSTHNVEVPFVKTFTYSVIDIQPNEDPSLPSHLSLMDDEGDSREDLDMPPDAALAAQIKEQFDSGKDVLVVVVSAMGIEQVLQTKNAAENCFCSKKMSDEDHDFTQQGGGDNASKTYPMAAGALKKGGYICINSRPCKVIDLSVSKTGKHGHAKVSIVATDIFTGNRLEDQAPSTHNVEVPFVKTFTYSVIDIQPNEDPSLPSHLSLMDDEGDSREDLDMPPDAALAAQIKEQFDSGKDVLVVVVSAMGIEQVLQTKNAAEK